MRAGAALAGLAGSGEHNQRPCHGTSSVRRSPAAVTLAGRSAGAPIPTRIAATITWAGRSALQWCAVRGGDLLRRFEDRDMVEARVDELAEMVRDGATEQMPCLSGWNIHGPSGWYPSVR